MLVAMYILLTVGVALALCCYAGWGAARLTLPASLRPLAWLCTPLVGYALLVWGGYIGVRTALSTPQSLALLLALATACNVTAWRATGDRGQGTGDRGQGTGDRGQGTGVRSQRAEVRNSKLKTQNSKLLFTLALLLLLVLTLLVGVWPLLRYGYLTAIGRGWDTESALPLARYLLDGPLARIPQNPISPLRDLVAHPPAIGKTLGFAVWQGMTMFATQQSALATFAPLLALLRAMGVLAVYIWLVATMGLTRRWALLGAALTSAGGLLLWVTYFNFEKQLAGWPLIPFGLTVGLAAIDDLAARRWAAWPALLLGALVIAAQPVAYYPALTIWLPLALALGAVRIVEIWRGERAGAARLNPLATPTNPAVAGWRARLRQSHAPALLAATAALAALTALLAAPTALDYFQGFSFRYSLPAQHVGPDRFIAPAEILGLQTFRIAPDGAQPPAVLTWLALALAGGFALAGLSLPTTDDRRPTTDDQSPITNHQSPRLRWLATLLTVVAYLLWLRFSRDYEYAYMKGSAYIAFVGWGLFALGAQALAARLAQRRAANSGRAPVRAYLLVAAALLPLLVTGWAQWLVVAEHDDGPAAFTRDVTAFEEAAKQIPAGASVLISGDEAFTGPVSGLFSAMLHGRAIWGHLVTAYSGLNYWPEGGSPQYALLAANERPWPLEHGGQELWRSGAAALYRLGGREQVLGGRAAQYSDSVPLSRGLPGALAIWRRGGPYRAARPDASLTLYLAETLRFTGETAQMSGDLQPRQLTLTLATLTPQHVTVLYNTANATFDLKAGVNTVTLSVLAPSAIVITPQQPLALIEATARAAPDHPPIAALDDGQIAWRASAELRGTTIGVGVDLVNPGRHALRYGFTLVEDTFQAPRQLVRLLAAAPTEGRWQLNVDPLRGATEALTNKAPTPLLNVTAQPGPADGLYFGVLTIYDGEEPVANAPVFTMQVAGGALTNFAAVPFSAEATPVGLGAARTSLRKAALGGTGVALDSRAATLEDAVIVYPAPAPGNVTAAPTVARGASLAVQLHWRGAQPAQPLMVSVQVLGADDHKWAQWDGPLGGAWRPLAQWQPGDRVRQDVPLTLDGAIPPGSYRLALIIYDPATGQPQPLGGQQALQLAQLTVVSGN